MKMWEKEYPSPTDKEKAEDPKQAIKPETNSGCTTLPKPLSHLQPKTKTKSSSSWSPSQTPHATTKHQIEANPLKA